MSRRGKETLVRGLPVVNLLSASEFERMAARRLRRRFVVGGLALALLVGGAWAFQHVRVTEARKLVAVEQAETTRLTSQTQVLAPVRAFVNGVAVQETTVQTAMVGEIYFSEVLDGIRDATPPGAQIAAVAVTLAAPTDPAATGGTVSACPGPDPFNARLVVGCVTLSGTAASRAEVGDMVVQLGHSSLFVEPFVATTTTADEAEVTFSGSVGLSEKVYSKRYGDPASVAAQPAPAATDGGS
jgi:hypothetical protein